ncbi:transglutaminase domain-containing protein [Flavobacterium poyangense]|uniref:transglutaminase domain-containing protein n=1 Tax=Flavobacterium poyangense TaxID=2204302 RepID=UPI0014213B11|nr:transglutaminase domain-containing protein [Flavobacterium sp. JXAS1]
MILKNNTIFVLFLSVFFLQSVYSQKYNAVDAVVLKYPKQFSSTEKLAERIEKDFTSDYDKARAIYSWIAFNISYDLATYLNPPKARGFSYSTELEKQQKIQLQNDKDLQKVFKSKKAVCEGFTLLYRHLATLVGLKCEIVRGDSKTRLNDIGRENTTSNHAWNMVLVDGKWRLVDVTWGEGYYDQSKRKLVKDFATIYFDTKPAYFFAKHFPDSGTYLGDRLSKSDFLNAPLIYNKTIEGDYEIIAPQSGTIAVKSGDKVTFRIKNVSKADPLFYLNRKNQPVRIENPKERGDSLEFQVVIDENIGQYLTFYLVESSIVSFKVMVK